MRNTFLLTLTAIMLLAGCSKTKTLINFNCKIADTYINSNVPALITGNAVASYNPGTGAFVLTMSAPNNQQVGVSWYNVDSLNGVKNLIPKTYTIQPFQYNTPSIAGAYQSQAGASYVTGGAANLGGTVTITTNTGAGGLISGSFSFNALDQSGSDTVYVTQGTFTNVGIPTQ